MYAASTPDAQSAFTAIHLRISGSNQKGRAFLPTAQLDKIKVDEVKRAFSEYFVEVDDEDRIRLLRDALAAPRIVVETYPGENEPIEYHCYVRSPAVSSAPLFACVLAPTAVIEHLLGFPPHIVFETSTFEAIGEEASAAAITAGIESWVKRVWPDAIVPAIKLVQWPDIEEASPVAGELIELPKVHFPNVPMHGAQERLSIAPASMSLFGSP